MVNLASCPLELQEPRNGGDLKINYREVNYRERAEVTVSSEGTGSAGDLKVTADSILLDDAGKLTATSASGMAGISKLQDLNLLLLRGNSGISTDASRGSGMVAISILIQMY
jgi:hypothetical protein